jgi:hypothetical protein
VATRLYVARTHGIAVAAVGGVRLGPAPFYIAPAAGWENSNRSNGEYELWLSTNTTEGRTDAQSDWGYGTNTGLSADGDLLLVRAWSAPMAGSQTISGTLKGQFAFQENEADDDARAQLCLRVIAPDMTVRGTLYDFDTNALGSDEFGTTGGTYYNRNVPRGGAQSVTSVAVSAGDRLLLELGARFHTAPGFFGTATVFIGTNASSGDLPEDQTTTCGLNVYRPWVELSHNVTWQADLLEVSQVVAQVGVKVNQAENDLEVSQVLMQVGARVFAHGWGIVEPGDVEGTDAVLGTNPGTVLGAVARDRGRSRATATSTIV